MEMTYKVERSNPKHKDVLVKLANDLRILAMTDDFMVLVKDVLRTESQNSKQWPMLRDIAAKVPMVINGVPQRATEQEWKAFLSAVFTQETTRFAQGPNGLVALGVSTKDFSKKDFSDYIEFLYCFGSERDVAWSEKALEKYETYRPTRLNGEIPR